MAMVVVAQRQILDNGFTFWYGFQHVANVSEEPWLIPFGNVVDLSKMETNAINQLLILRPVRT